MNIPLIQSGCKAPWEWYSVDIEFGTWRNCPRLPSRIIGEDYAFNNHPEQLERREFWLNGKKHPTCNDCWESENAGGITYSSVLGWNKWIKDPTIHYRAPHLLEIKFSNLCNLQCITCTGKWSSTWEDERPSDVPKIPLDQQEILKEKLFQYIKENYNNLVAFNLMGGEIVLHKGFYELFELILDAPKNATKKEISFSTNGYYSESYKNTFETYIEKLLDDGHEMFARFSTDGIGDKGTYQRSGLNWKKFENNFTTFVDRFKVYDRTRFRANVALNIINLCSLDEITEFLTEKNMHIHKKIQDIDNNNTEGPIVEPHYNFVSGPEMFYIKSYGTKLKHAINTIEKQNFYDYVRYKEHVLKLTNSYSNEPINKKAIIELQHFIENNDKRYNKNFAEIFPENDYLFT